MDDFRHGRVPGFLFALGSDANTAAQELRGQLGGIPVELRTQVRSGSLAGAEFRDRLRSGGERLEAEQGAVTVADQEGGELVVEPLLELRFVRGSAKKGGADEDLARVSSRRSWSAQL